MVILVLTLNVPIQLLSVMTMDYCHPPTVCLWVSSESQMHYLFQAASCVGCYFRRRQQSDTNLSLMSGMLIQLAAATAAKGTHLPISGGAVCEHRENIYIRLRSVKKNKLRYTSCFILHCCGLCIMAEGRSAIFRKDA